MKDQYIIRARQTIDVFFLAEGKLDELLEQLGARTNLEDFEILGEKEISTFVAGISLATEEKLKELEQYVV